jgi:hypothetical protein
MSADLFRSGQAVGLAQIPSPLFGETGKARPGVAPARTSATPGIQGQRGEAEPGSGDMLSDSLPEGLILGLDAGAKTSGFAVFDPRSRAILALGELDLRQDIHMRMEDRAQNRRTRRAKKWYREKRFSNREREKDWLTPTMRSKIAAHLHLIQWLTREYPIKTVIIEHGAWDLQALKRGKVKLAGWQYRKGPLYGYENVKQMVRIRDDSTCQACLIDYKRREGHEAKGEAYKAIKKRTQERGVEVGHLTPRSWGSDSPENLVVLCHQHNVAQGQRTIEEFGYPELRRKHPRLKWAGHVNTYVRPLIRSWSPTIESSKPVVLSRKLIGRAWGWRRRTTSMRRSLPPRETPFLAGLIPVNTSMRGGWAVRGGNNTM